MQRKYLWNKHFYLQGGCDIVLTLLVLKWGFKYLIYSDIRMTSGIENI
jgi:hypothetical protein